MKLENIMLSEVSQTQKDHLHNESKIVKLIIAENRIGVAKDWKEGEGAVLANGTKVLLYMINKS